MTDEIWEIDPENKKHVDKDIAQFILEQGEKALRHTIDVSDKATNRAFSMLLILLPVSSTIIGFLINEIKKARPYQHADIYFFCTLAIICIVALIYIIKVVYPRNTMEIGREPKNIAVSNMLQGDKSSEEKLRVIKLNEIKNCQYKIDYNRKQNAERVLLVSKITKYVGISALIAIAIYLMLLSLLASR
jgi:hypothetical protein